MVCLGCVEDIFTVEEAAHAAWCLLGFVRTFGYEFLGELDEAVACELKFLTLVEGFRSCTYSSVFAMMFLLVTVGGSGSVY
jgi:hypothetical protein